VTGVQTCALPIFSDLVVDLDYVNFGNDANEAVARVAHKTNEVCAIYPITPASPMGEHVDVRTCESMKSDGITSFAHSSHRHSDDKLLTTAKTVWRLAKA